MDPYKILGIDKDASPAEIRRAYRKKAAKFHPDKDGESWIFQQIQDAYDELMGKKKKKRKKKEQSSQPQSEQPEPTSGYGSDPFEFDIPDPEPTYDSTYGHQRPPKTKAKKKNHATLVFAVCGMVLGIVAIGFLIWWFNQSGSDQRLASETNPHGSATSDTQKSSNAGGLAGRQSPANRTGELKTASVSLVVTPSDADIVVFGTGVTVEGSGRNRTIHFASPDPKVAYKLFAVMQGYQSYSDEIRIDSGDRKQISIVLQKRASVAESPVGVGNSNRVQMRTQPVNLPKGFLAIGETPLFNGQNYLGLRYERGSELLPRSKVWRLDPEHRILKCLGTGDKSMLVTDNNYDDFILELEWRIPLGAEISKDGCCIMVRARDDFSKWIAYHLTDGPMAAAWVTGQAFTPILGKCVKEFENRLIINPNKPKKAVGEWNTLKMTCAGSEILIDQNGKRVLHLTAFETDAGPISLRSQGTAMEFRNVKLTLLERKSNGHGSESGFVSLFNGKDLQEWSGDPRYWRVSDGMIVGRRPRNSGGDSCAATKQSFKDFVLKLKFKLNSGDSGIQFRGELMPDYTMSGNQANLCYENNLRELAWLYVNKEKVAWPSARSREAMARLLNISGWNEYVITAIGSHIKLEINGIVVVNDKRNGPKEGAIGLHLHRNGADVAFKDIFIKDLAARERQDNHKVESEANRIDSNRGAEFVSLFNGNDLKNWNGDSRYWTVEDGAITGRTRQPTTKNTFLIWENGKLADFDLKLKFKITSGNSGVQFRSKDEGNFVVSGYQLDIDSSPHKFIGSLYDELGRGKLAERMSNVTIEVNGDTTLNGKIGSENELLQTLNDNEWNTLEIHATGNGIEQRINGVTTVRVVDKDLESAAESGVLAFQLHAGPPMKVQFKDIELRKNKPD